MPVYFCRWPNGDLSIVQADDADDAIVVLDELGDASEAELFETGTLLVDFKLTATGSLELIGFGEDIEIQIMENAYPLLWKARLENEDDENEFPEAAAAEIERLSQSRPPELAKNLLIASWADERNITLSTALKRYQQSKPLIGKGWRDLAAKIESDLYHGGPPKARAQASEVAVTCDPADKLPHYLLTAYLAAEMNASVVVTWKDVKKHLDQEIGTYWHWQAQQVRLLKGVIDHHQN